jgi:hypothetical protein
MVRGYDVRIAAGVRIGLHDERAQQARQEKQATTSGGGSPGEATTATICSAVCRANTPPNTGVAGADKHAADPLATLSGDDLLVFKMFRLMDLQNKGFASKPKFRAAVVRAGSTVEEADAIFAYADKNNDGRMQLREFTVLMAEEEAAPGASAHEEL